MEDIEGKDFPKQSQKQSRRDIKVDLLNRHSHYLRVFGKDQLSEQTEKLEVKTPPIPRTSDFVLIAHNEYEDKKICDFFNETFYLPISKLQWQLEKKKFDIKKLQVSENEEYHHIQALDAEAKELVGKIYNLEINFYESLPGQLKSYFKDHLFEVSWFYTPLDTFELNIFDNKTLYLTIDFIQNHRFSDGSISRVIKNITQHFKGVNLHICLSLQEPTGLNLLAQEESYIFLHPHFNGSNFRYFSYPTNTYWNNIFLPPNHAHKKIDINESNINSPICFHTNVESNPEILPLNIETLNRLGKLSLMRL